jgi:transcriptional regulator with XRE-family HTH domain
VLVRPSRNPPPRCAAVSGAPRRQFDDRRLARRREGAGLSHTDLAYRLYDHTGREYHPVRIGRWERGVVVPNINDVLSLSEVLGCTVDDLCGPAAPRGAAAAVPARRPRAPRRSAKP